MIPRFSPPEAMSSRALLNEKRRTQVCAREHLFERSCPSTRWKVYGACFERRQSDAKYEHIGVYGAHKTDMHSGSNTGSTSLTYRAPNKTLLDLARNERSLHTTKKVCHREIEKIRYNQDRTSWERNPTRHVKFDRRGEKKRRRAPRKNAQRRTMKPVRFWSHVDWKN